MEALTITILFFISIVNQTQETPHKQLKIAIVDSGLDLKDPRFAGHLCPSGHKNFVDKETIEDKYGHGTCITNIVERYAGEADYCLLIYKYWSPEDNGKENIQKEFLAFTEAVKNKADIINLSAGGPGIQEEEKDFIQKNKDTIFVVSSGNESEDLDIEENAFYPASYDYGNIIAVGSVDKDGKRSKFSNFGKKVNNYEMGENVQCFSPNKKDVEDSGTSMAAAIFTGKLIEKLSKTNKDGADYVHKLGF